MKKQMLWKTKGMNQDLSVSAFNPEFSFENMNLRLSTNEGNTLLSWVNEKGTEKIQKEKVIPEYWSKEGEEDVYVDPQDESWTHHDAVTTVDSIILEGTPIGTAVLNHKLVIFTTKTTSEEKVLSGNNDYIYVLEYCDNDKTIVRFTGYTDKDYLYNGNLNFSTKYPLETLVSYEAEHIQKVYWTDGRNQPRVINISSSPFNKEKLDKWQASSNATCFDFIPTLKTSEKLTVTKKDSGGGLFAPGVIQYVFTYMNKYGQQSNVVDISPLYYLSKSDRGANPEEKVTSCFEIKIKDADSSFDYVVIYSIQRTSVNAVPFIRQLEYLPIKNAQILDSHSYLSFTDSGTTGSTIDPTELLYVGGKEIKALTMIDKDGTLFLGNISQESALVDSIQAYYDNLRAKKDDDDMGIKFSQSKSITLKSPAGGFYSHTQMLDKNLKEISTFKGGEIYRFGFQLQKKTGEWTEPIFMNDVINDYYPVSSVKSNTVNLVKASATINPSVLGSLSSYKRIRPLIVYPTISDRKVLCQGVLNPTVFNIVDRIDNTPFAQASWYFRPFCRDAETSGENIKYGENITLAISDLTENPDLSMDSFYLQNGLVNNVYVLIANVPEDLRDTIFNRHLLGIITPSRTWGGHGPNSYTETSGRSFGSAISGHGYIGLIDLGDGVYAFLSNSEWPVEHDWVTESHPSTQGNWTVTTQTRVEYTDGITIINNENIPFQIFSGLRKTEQYFMYYYKPDPAAPNSYAFKFYAGDKYYVVTYKAIETENPEISDNLSGEVARFMHYQYLMADSQLSTNQTNLVNIAKQVEIQGSGVLYSNVFKKDTTSGSGTSSGGRVFGGNRSGLRTEDAPPTNTQFFIDQSIVTLNSPDIEFDTEVQSYGTDGLGLRIIGAIPITGNISAHSINTSSNMLEAYHNNGGSSTFGAGELLYNTRHDNNDTHAGRRLIADYLWNDVSVVPDASKDDKIQTTYPRSFLIYPWQKSGSLTDDVREDDKVASKLKTKKESNLLFSSNSEYFPNKAISIKNTSTQFHLTENEQVLNIRLSKQKYQTTEINYYPNIDKVLYNKTGYEVRTQDILYKRSTETSSSSAGTFGNGDYMPTTERNTIVHNPIPMKYKSTSHAAIALRADDLSSEEADIPMLPYGYSESEKIGKFVKPEGYTNTTIWEDDNVSFDQKGINLENQDSAKFNFLWLGELYKNPQMPFGGKGKEALLANNWEVAGQAVDIPTSGNITLEWTNGDTFYQRYDCLKTYPFTKEDVNQVVEILSFMCESHINLDGRWDRNRGQVDNTNMSPQNFNLMNDVYNQRDNFFNYKKLDNEGVTETKYPNQLTFTKTKNSGADTDLWTNITLASSLEMDGDKGAVKSLNRLNDQLICFQDSGIAQILYNENVQVSTESGVPIEIANSGKVQGKRYLSNTVGCSNKWSIVQTPNGLYFMDSNDKSIYLFNGQLQNMSVAGGFNTWSKQNIPSQEMKWTPDDFDNFVSYYDKLNQDVLWINKSRALAFSEKLSAFTSFYDYGSTPYFSNLDDTGIWIKSNGSLWKHQAGDYCKFFDSQKPYWMTLVGNPEPQTDKIFTNLEFRACVKGDGESDEKTGKFTSTPPFDSLETWNEYQHGFTTLENKSGHSSFVHGTDSSSLKRKFRIWRNDIPRNNYKLLLVPDREDYETEEEYEKALEAYNTWNQGEIEKGISRKIRKPLDRMRNPWLYLKLQKNAAEEGKTLDKTEIHDIMLTYFG